MKLEYSKSKLKIMLIEGIILFSIIIGLLIWLFFYFVKILFDNGLILLIITFFTELFLAGLLYYFLIHETLKLKNFSIEIKDENEIIIKDEDDIISEYLIYDIKVFKVRYKNNKVRSIKFLLKKNYYNLFIFDDEDLLEFLNIIEKRMNYDKS